MEEHSHIFVFTDGSCRGNPGPMGIGIVIIPNINDMNTIVKFGKKIGNGTNNIAELTAIKIGIENALKYNKPIILFTDSEYSINVVTGRYKAKANIDLINDIQKLIKLNSIQIKYVKGHDKNVFNNIADSLATQYSK